MAAVAPGVLQNANPPRRPMTSKSMTTRQELLWREVVRRMKLRQTGEQIARAMQISSMALWRWRTDPRFRELMIEMDCELYEETDARISDLQADIDEAAPRAFTELMSILEISDDERLRVGVAQDILDRAGFGAVKRAAVAHTIRIDPQTVQALVDGFNESLDLPPVAVVDVVPSGHHTNDSVARAAPRAGGDVADAASEPT